MELGNFLATIPKQALGIPTRQCHVPARQTTDSRDFPSAQGSIGEMSWQLGKQRYTGGHRGGTEEESILSGHPHSIAHSSLLFKTIKISSVKTHEHSLHLPHVKVYLFLSIRLAPKV